MTSGNVIPARNGDTALATRMSTTSPQVDSQRWAQPHALRALAEFLDRLDQPGLSLSVNEDRITVQVPADLGGEPHRATAVARLAAALGTRPRREPGRTVAGTWLVADAHLGGHPVHVFTLLDDNDDHHDHDDDNKDTDR